MTQPVSKAQARAQAKAQRIAMDAIARLDASAAIRQRLLDLPELHEADTIFAYVSMQDEVATHKLLDQLLEQGKTVAVPVVRGEEIIPHLLNDLEDLYPDRFDIPAPQTRIPLDLTPDVTIVPGLAFTPDGDRLGRGGGYYDRYLAAHRGTTPIGVCFETQILEALPTEPNDITIPVIVTEQRVIRAE